VRVMVVFGTRRNGLSIWFHGGCLKYIFTWLVGSRVFVAKGRFWCCGLRLCREFCVGSELDV
jgi:hypothetical protein